MSRHRSGDAAVKKTGKSLHLTASGGRGMINKARDTTAARAPQTNTTSGNYVCVYGYGYKEIYFKEPVHVIGGMAKSEICRAG